MGLLSRQKIVPMLFDLGFECFRSLPFKKVFSKSLFCLDLGITPFLLLPGVLSGGTSRKQIKITQAAKRIGPFGAVVVVERKKQRKRCIICNLIT
jgi:hypothetical protein